MVHVSEWHRELQLYELQARWYQYMSQESIRLVPQPSIVTAKNNTHKSLIRLLFTRFLPR